jgi:hypothetical protein
MQRFDYSGDSLETAIIQAFPYEMKPFWFKVTVDSKGNVTGAYFARREITSKDMRPVDSDLQKKMVLNPYMGEDSITGMWTLADQMRTEKMWGTQGDAEGNH